MQFPHRPRKVTIDLAVSTLETEGVSSSLIPLPRRRILHALPGVAVGGVVLLGLASCGGEDEEGDGGGNGEVKDDD